MQDWAKTIKTKLKNNELRRNDYIRISFAYLFRIHINGRYLLVQNERDLKKYQPVGGAYKSFEKENAYLDKRLSVVDDGFNKLDNWLKVDYRMKVPVCKFKKFIKRFNKTTNRENLKDLTREFAEELVDTKIVNAKTFEFVNYIYCGRHIGDIKYSQKHKCYELLMADIVELIPTAKQEQELATLQQTKNEKYYWASSDEMSLDASSNGKKNIVIANNAYKILHNNNKDLKYRKNNQAYEVKVRAVQ